ncbi:PREDICTED: calcium-activated chloride channel regulator 4-like [Chinchilla lanigera]|uniref:calcium-activated chloride channel regulator 4-like n=1 Tax=Chinchilla lanigera TaxID=34839 RepID=UPI00038EC137|nr:PREDICTED: calcium-activated chloride channel regulator 4-like [Chinchilla lanigera]
MTLLRALASLLVLHLLQGSSASLVQLKDNGYEDVIVAIDPGVPEDGEIIEQIKDMVTTASTYLFEATEKRFFFKTVSILIPKNWKENSQYRRPKHESYKQADVIVAPPTLPGQDEPYTKQLTECGAKAEYIHFTPDFVLGKKQNEYGPSGRVFVHEWAHLRWGVFDEYNNDQPYYMSRLKKIEATRCSIGMFGTNSVYKCQDGSCITRRCRIDSTTKLYEKDCQFFPDKVQTEKASIMFTPKIDSVVEFCNEKNHNQEAPTLQNLKCNFRSTWEVIRESEDFKSVTPMVTPPPLPAFSLLKISERTVCLVLDKSENMKDFNRLYRMNQAAKTFLLQTIENGSWVGIVEYDSTTHIKSKLVQITSYSERRKLLECLPTEASGGISICSGIESALQVIREKHHQTEGSEIILVTAGENKSASSCVDRVIQSGAIVHSVALGPSADVILSVMSSATGGNHYYASDQAYRSSFTDAFRTFESGNAGPSQMSFQLESKRLTLNNEAWMNGTVIVDSTLGKDTFFSITWDKQTPSISVWAPSGKLVGGLTEDTASRMAYLSISGTAPVGTWTYNLQAKANSETLTIAVTSRAADSAVPPITVSAKMNKDTNSFPSPMVVYAEVRQGYVPILGVNVTAVIESSSGNTEVLELLDNGAGADFYKNDGIYSRYFTSYKENGIYSLKVQACGGRNTAMRSLRRPMSPAKHISGCIVDGKIEENVLNPKIDEDTQPILESFSRTVSGGVFVISQVPPLPVTDLYPPNQIRDLDATLHGDEVCLTWTAPGDDFDVGKVQQYTIRISGSVLDLRDHFEDALQVNTTDLLPNEANSKQTFTFKPGKISEENSTHLFIAIQSVDKSNLTSKVSNIAQVALFIPLGEPSPHEGHRHPGANTPTLVLVVVGSVAIICLLLSATIYILKKKKKSK